MRRIWSALVGCCRTEIPDHWHRCPLRVRGNGLAATSAADFDELAPSHSITSSAVVSNLSGTEGRAPLRSSG